MLDRKVAMPATATPMAATVPTSIFLGSGGFAAVASALVLSACTVCNAAACVFCRDSSSAAEARLATCSSIMRTNRLYGAQAACRMLMGFSMMRVTVASQSLPLWS